MKTTLMGLFVFVLSIAALSAHAGEYHYGKRYNACMHKSGGTTVGMLDCIGAETSRQDKRLNNNYQKLMKSLSKESQETLRKVERIWIKYRDADCDFSSSLVGGTLGSTVQASCFMDATARRADRLANYLKDLNAS